MTAQRVAMRRAAHQLIDNPRVFEDALAVRILGPEIAAALKAEPENELERRLRAFMVVRSRYAEEQLVTAVSRGVKQYVVLGAGLDTFAYRNPYPDVLVFEIDYPATQGWKRQRLEAGRSRFPRACGLRRLISTNRRSSKVWPVLDLPRPSRDFSRGWA